jgi:hypothetical protein
MAFGTVIVVDFSFAAGFWFALQCGVRCRFFWFIVRG